jgi:hypothetical protein
MTGAVWIQIIFIISGALAAAAGFVLRRAAGRGASAGDDNPRRSGRKQTLGSLLLIAGCWLFLTRLLALVSGASEETAAAGTPPGQISLLGLQLFSSFLAIWAVMLLRGPVRPTAAEG